MGWPQQLDVRLDGKLVKRFTVGGNAKGRPAALSYAGDGEPGFAGDPEWEKYMQLTGDAGLEVRIPVEAGPRVVGVSFVRELWEPEGLPHPPQRGRTIANDNVYMGYANVGSVQIGGPYKATGPAQDTPSRRAIFVCQPQSQLRGTRLRDHDPVEDRPARLSPAGDEGGPADAARILRPWATGRSEASTPAFSSRSSECSSTRTSCCACIAIGRRPRGARVRRLSDLEVASRLSFFLWSSIPDERLLDLAERKQLATSGDPRTRGAPDAGRSARHDALVDGFAAQWLNLRRVGEVVVDPDRYPTYDESLLQAFQRETELLRRRARCARIAASSSCSTRTTRSSTSGWLATTGSRASTAAASGASRSPNPISAAGCSRTDRCWRRRPIPIARRRSCAASFC